MLNDIAREAIWRFYRSKRGALVLSQTQAADAAKLHRTTLSKIEAGKIEPTPAQRRALARLLRVSVKDIPTTKRAA